MPKYVIAKKNEPRALVSNTIDMCKDSLDKDGENSVYEDEKDIVYIYFTEWIAKEYYQQGKKEVETKN